MKPFMRKPAFIALAASSLAIFTQAHAQENPAPVAPVVVELFTSQACSACTKAAAHFSELAKRDDVVAISWHVDYWTEYETEKGRWSDPYSTSKCTDRQRMYNKKLRARSSVYTPQMVINGAIEAVGSDRDEVDALITAAHDGKQRAQISSQRNNEMLSFTIDAAPDGAEAFLITFRSETVTRIDRGENAGLHLNEANIATGIRPLGEVSARRSRIETSAPEEEEGCALIVQEPGQGRIVAAAYCAAVAPSAATSST